MAARADERDGVISRDQLREIGIGDDAIRYLVGCKLLRRVHRGVYAVGTTALTPRGRRFAAVLAGGDGALLSHLSGGINYEISSSLRARFDVTVAKQRRSTKQIQFHETRTLAPQDRATHDGIPCTSVARTLLDMAEQTRRPRTVERALNQAFIAGLLAPDEITDVLARANGRIGAPILDAAFQLYRDEGPMPTRSVLEQAMLEICRREGLPRPECNRVLLGRERDFVWPGFRLVVEVDGFATHNTPWAFQDDRWRDVDLEVAGFVVLRFAWQAVISDPGRVAAALSAWFADARARAGGAASRRRRNAASGRGRR